ncbi:hypothetical protein B4914_01050 [Yersinia entomophaga]|nr:hypothetical protein B4914_01050 [Yersinia entomophaga]
MSCLGNHTASTRLGRYLSTFQTLHNKLDHCWRGSSKGSCSVKYFFMGISFMLVVWIGTFMLMVE